MNSGRRLWSGGTAAMALVVAMAWCGSDDGSDDEAGCEPAGEPVTLEYYSWVPGMDQVVETWNQAHPDIQVEFLTGPTGRDAYQNFFNQLEAGNAPDLIQIEYDALANFRLQGGLVNLADCAGVMEAGSQFVDWTWQQVTFGEQDAVYAIPQDTGPMGLWYRADLFEEAGIEVPETWDEYYQAALAIREEGGHIHHFSDGDTQWFLAMIWQLGGRWFSVDGDEWTVDLTGPESTQVAEYWQRMVDEELVRPLPGFTDEYYAALDAGEIWTWVSPYWANALIEQNAPNTAGEWEVAYMPQWAAGQRAAGNWGGSTAAVTASSEHPYEAAQFALWLNTDPAALAAENELGGLYPATLAGQTMPSVSQPNEFFSGQDISAVFAEAAQNIDPDFPWGPTMNQTYNDLADGFARVVGGEETFADALAGAEQSTIDTLRSQSIPVADG